MGVHSASVGPHGAPWGCLGSCLGPHSTPAAYRKSLIAAETGPQGPCFLFFVFPSCLPPSGAPAPHLTRNQ